MIIYSAFIMHAAIPSCDPPPLCLSCDILFFLNTICSVIFFFPNVLSAAAEGYLPCLTSCYQQIFTLLKSSVHTSVSPSHSLWSSEKWVLEYPYKGKEIFRVKVGVRYGEVCLTGREWQIKPTGSLSLHLRADNAGLPISVHELHQFSGSIVEINVSFPSLCLSNTALSYLCQSVSFSDFLPRPGMLDEMSVCYQTGMRLKGANLR